MDEIDDRRGSGRVYIMTSVTLDIAGQTVDATALDLSQTGVSVWAPEGHDAPQSLSITMLIDDGGPMTLNGRVARQFESDGGSVWGIAFEGVQPDQQSRLDAYLETLG